MIKELFNLFFPHLCVCCGRVLNKQEYLICEYCKFDLPYTNYHTVTDNPIEQRFWGRVDIERATSLLFFSKGSKVQSIIHHLKYDNYPEVGVLLGRMAALMCSSFFHDVDCLVPVPLHLKKMKKRGYNQSSMICSGISDVLLIEQVSDLKRTVNANSQTKKSKIERYMNAIDNFEFSNSDSYSGKNIALIDDVITTGATLESCVMTIKKAQPKVKISVFTLCCAGL